MIAKGLDNLIQDYVTEDTVMVEISSSSGASTEAFTLRCGEIYVVTEGESATLPAYGYGLAWPPATPPVTSSAHDKFNKQSLDMVYINEHYTYDIALENIRLWMPKIKVGGILSGRNYGLPEIKKLVGNISDFIPDQKIYENDSWAFTKPSRHLIFPRHGITFGKWG